MFHEYFDRYFAQLTVHYSAYANKINIGRENGDEPFYRDCWFRSIECDRAVLVPKERQKVEYVKKNFSIPPIRAERKNVYSQNTAFAEG